MTSSEPSHTSLAAGAGQFAPTRWSVVLAAGRSDSTHTRTALEKLCRTHWPPIYAFVRRQGYSPPDAQDLTQEFFVRLLEKNWMADVDQSKGSLSFVPARGSEAFPRQRMGQSHGAKAWRRTDFNSD